MTIWLTLSVTGTVPAQGQVFNLRYQLFRMQYSGDVRECPKLSKMQTDFMLDVLFKRRKRCGNYRMRGSTILLLLLCWWPTTKYAGPLSIAEIPARLTAWQNFMYGAKRKCVQNPRSSISDEVGSRFWKNVCHWIGAVGLLKVRQQEGYRENLPLYRAVRRPIVSRTSGILDFHRFNKSLLDSRLYSPRWYNPGMASRWSAIWRGRTGIETWPSVYSDCRSPIEVPETLSSKECQPLSRNGQNIYCGRGPKPQRCPGMLGPRSSRRMAIFNTLCRSVFRNTEYRFFVQWYCLFLHDTRTCSCLDTFPSCSTYC